MFASLAASSVEWGVVTDWVIVAVTDRPVGEGGLW
jgi:hypothetical protein